MAGMFYAEKNTPHPAEFSDHRLGQELCDAIISNDVGAVQRVVKVDSGLPAIRGKNGSTWMHFAVHHAKPEMIGWLAASGFGVDDRNLSSETPLWDAVFKVKSCESASALLAAGANPDALIGGAPILFFLASRSDFGCTAQERHDSEERFVRLLLRHGADPSLGSNIVTPLHCSAGYGRRDEVLLFLEHGADPSVSIRIDGKDVDVFEYAIRNRHPDLAQEMRAWMAAHRAHQEIKMSETLESSNQPKPLAP